MPRPETAGRVPYRANLEGISGTLGLIKTRGLERRGPCWQAVCPSPHGDPEGQPEAQPLCGLTTVWGPLSGGTAP